MGSRRVLTRGGGSPSNGVRKRGKKFEIKGKGEMVQKGEGKISKRTQIRRPGEEWTQSLLRVSGMKGEWEKRWVPGGERWQRWEAEE